MHRAQCGSLICESYRGTNMHDLFCIDEVRDAIAEFTGPGVGSEAYICNFELSLP